MIWQSCAVQIVVLLLVVVVVVQFGELFSSEAGKLLAVSTFITSFIIIIIRGFIVRLLPVIVHRCITESSELSANRESQTKKCVLSRFLKSPGSVTAHKSFSSEFHADGPAYVKARSPNLVHNCGREKSDDDEDRKPRRGWHSDSSRRDSRCRRESPGTSRKDTACTANSSIAETK